MSAPNVDGIIKSCRDIMRKDKGMNTDAQRIPQLLWMLFLKCFDDFELQKEILGDYKPIIEKPYKWRDWTDSEKGRRGDELIEFVNNDLFKHLSSLHGEGADDQRDVVADIFSEQKNFMTDGYGMKDMIQQINKLDLTSSEQFHLIGTVYEKMLLSMKDDSPGTFGEFYTPRPIIRFMVNMIKPSLKNRETILDPACGTAGFLIESYNHLEKQVKGTKENEFLQKKCLSGIEPRPEPYLFGMMNMMLHGIEQPNIARVNTLETKLSDIQENLQHDIILTNPPFGGEENDSIKKKLPAGFQTKDTATGFLLHCIKRLKDDGKCGIILPTGDLLSSEGGISERVREKFLEECNLHTIIQLQKSVFKPYAGMPTNILFFEKPGPTKEIWYYEMELPLGYKAYNKTNPITIDDFSDIVLWWNQRKENNNAWKVKISDLKNLDLDSRNPKKKNLLFKRTPHDIINEFISNEEKILKILNDAKKFLEKENSEMKNFSPNEEWQTKKLGDPTVAQIILGQSPPGDTYNKDGEGLPFFQGSKDFGLESPKTSTWCSQPKKIAEKGDILISVRAPVGDLNWAKEKCCIGRGLAAIRVKINPKFVYYYCSMLESQLAISGKRGIFNTIGKDFLYNLEIPVPDNNTQTKICNKLDKILNFQNKIGLKQNDDEKIQKETEKKFEKFFKDLKIAILVQTFSGNLVK